MSSNPENSQSIDSRELDLLRYFFEFNHRHIDPVHMQEIALQHYLRDQMIEQSNTFTPASFKPKDGNSSTPEVPRIINYSQIPEPKIIFQYVPSPQFPTPSSTPEPQFYDDTNPYQKAQIKTKNFHIEDRCNFIKLKDEQNRKVLMTPTSSHHESDLSDHENLDHKSCLPPLKMSTKTKLWQGYSIYNNLPDIVMTEYDKILRESHSMKMDVVDALNQAYPVNYEYNPKKSRIRTNYSDPHVADDRTRNNIASRRSRQRKKFLNHVLQYSVEYDDDENHLLSKQEKWLREMIANLEKKIVTNSNDDMKIYKLRKQCGFE